MGASSLALRSSILLAVAALLVPSTSAQVSQSVVRLGGPGSVASNGTADPGVLADGTAPHGLLEFTYDGTTATLDVNVHNASPAGTSGVAPVLGEVFFNLPLSIAATSATLVSQTSASGADPGYAMIVDANPYDGVAVNDANGFGSFGVRLVPPTGGGIANEPFGVPTGKVAGPASFKIQLAGAGGIGLEQLSAEYPRRLFSQVPTGSTNVLRVNAVGRFDQENGETVAFSSPLLGCSPIMFWSGSMKIGTVQNLFLQANTNCHGCEVFSSILAQSNLPDFLGFQLEMGGPQNDIRALIPFLFLSDSFQILPFLVPKNPNLAGVTLYWVFVTNPVEGVSTSFEPSPLITTTFLP